MSDLIYVWIGLLALGLLITFIGMVFTWSEISILNKKVNMIQEDLERNYDLDSHQENSLNYLRKKHGKTT